MKHTKYYSKMKIKSLLIAVVAMITFTATSNKAQAQVHWDNYTPCYYVAVFISLPCPLTGFKCPQATSDYYYDVPNNYSWTENGTGLIDQTGNYQSPTDINGLCLKDINTGQTYFIDFCVWGPSGTVTFPNGCGGGPTTVDWNLNAGGTSNVRIW